MDEGFWVIGIKSDHGVRGAGRPLKYRTSFRKDFSVFSEQVSDRDSQGGAWENRNT